MVAIAGQHVLSPLGGIVNDRLTPALQGFAVDYWPAYDAIVAVSPQGALVTAFPVAANGRVISGSLARTFSDDYYHRVHLRPRLLELGNVISTQVSEIRVWNAYLAPITLAAIDGLDEGITLAGPDVFPMPLAGLQEIIWDVSVTPDGPTTIDVTLTWDFSGVPDATMRITGIRIVAWTITPDWTDGVRERLAWATDVMASETRKEQRRAMRLSPRRSFGARMIVEGRERTLFDVMMHGWGGRVWALPIWPDIQRLSSPVALGATSISCSTTGRDFRVGGLAMLRGESASASETVEIDAVESDSLTLLRPTQRAWPARTRLYPARTARFTEQPKTRRLTDRLIDVDATFTLVEPCDWAEAVLDTYRGFPVLAARPDESEDLTGTYERMLRMLDNGSGIPFVLDTAESTFGVQGHRWVLNGVTERSDFRSLLYALRGRQVSVWLPTHADDLTLIETIAGASVSMTVANVGYARFGLGELGRQDVRIELRDGTVFMRRITNAAEVDEDSEQLTIDAALGQSVAPTDVRRISFMMLARNASDEVEIRHVTDVEGVATSQMTLVGVADE